MYDALKGFLLRVLKVPAEPLDPMGDVRTLRVFRAAPGYLRYLMVGWFIKQAFILVGALLVVLTLFAGSMHGEGVAFLVLTLIEILALLLYPLQALISFLVLRLNYEMRWYKITDRSLRIREGIMSIHEMTMTFANIQNITITQGPLERLFGIANVRVETAGGGGSQVQQQEGHGLALNLHVGTFRGVDNAEEIRDLMMERLRRLRDTGLGDIDDKQTEKPAAAPVLPMSDLLAMLRDEARALHRAAEQFSA